MDQFVQTEFKCVIGWELKGVKKSINEITNEDIESHVHERTPPKLILPDVPFEIPFSKKTQVLLMHGFPSQPGIIPGLLGAKKMDLDLSTVDFIFGGSTMNMLSSQKITNGESWIAQKCSAGPIILQKNKSYLNNLMQTGFVFERIATGRRPHQEHDTVSTESVHMVEINRFRVLFVAECDACLDDSDHLVEIKSGDSPMQNMIKTILQMLSSRSSTLIVGKINKALKVHKLESIDRYELCDLIAQHKEKLDNCMNTIISNLHILHDMQGCNEVTFKDNKLVLSQSDKSIVPPDEIFEKLKA